MIQRMVEHLQKDMKARKADKKDVPESEDAQKMVGAVLEIVNKICDEVTKDLKSKVGR